MNGITGYSSTPLDGGMDASSRFAPKLKPEIKRVASNPFYPDGRMTSSAQTRTYEDQRQVFESNLPVSQREAMQKVGTVLNTLA